MEKNSLPIILIISTITAVIACNKGYGGWGWGEIQPVIWKPTLLPKLKQAFIDGKLSVDYHKIIAPSLKPLPYKKGVGWIGKGWVPHHGLGLGYGGHGYGFNAISHGYGHYDYPIAIGKTRYLGVGYGKGYGYGKGAFGKGAGIGIEYGKHVGVVGHGIPHPIPPPHGPVGHIGHTVSQNSVTVVEKGLPHVGIPHGPVGNGLYGKK